MSETAIRERDPRGELSAEHTSAGAVSTLRGATVAVDPRRLRRTLALFVVLSLVGLSVALVAAGARKNAQVTQLHNHGVPVTVTVTGCIGLMGGSGSNAAGYSCRGRYSLAGRSYHEALPGTTWHQPGSTLSAVAVPGDPALVAPSAMVAAEHTSWRVYLVPLVIVLALAFGFPVLWRRTARAGRRSD